MTTELNRLADEIVNEIEKEDFIYALKHYGCYKIKTTAEKVLRMVEEIDGVEKWK